MSNRFNEEWLEQAWMNFRDAAQNGQTSLAKEIIKDTEDNGFTSEANHMRNEL